MMSRSLNPLYDGLAHGLVGGRQGLSDSVRGVASLDVMSRSFAGFHLNVADHPMNASVDKLFEEGEKSAVNNVTRLPTVAVLPTVSEVHSRSSATVSQPLLLEKTPELSNQSSSADRRRSSGAVVSPNADAVSPAGGDNIRDSSAELYREYQKQRQRVQDQLAEREKQRLVQQQALIQQEQQKAMIIKDNRFLDETDSPIKTELISNSVPSKGRGCLFCVCSYVSDYVRLFSFINYQLL
jgi:hypothetical protein